ncbi:hypothetical protein [Jiulongibacter sediminis]|uniref:Uncharacterized protein n=1 Tax=Jiulongibacter sediminis TaxID=1605367 RepID=A0A0P7BQA8_9BACT|nr:hypothetical protein [Jiulongibacter sediminis]KPM49330.1 hypothetical protein AFM12_01525 [Jiulongibacter sediminis]TBX26382.1 hypothetical protein TK44_01530 [Jiulongibacter sediminis]
MTNIQEATSENELSNDMLKALWQVKKGNWDRAHEIAQSNEGQFDYDRIHAYLHRVEGDLFNAKWWYRQLGLAFPSITLDEEWELLADQYS